MSWFSKIAFSVRSLFSKKKLEKQMSDEMRIHLEMETEAKLAAGMSPEEARYAAQREFGNVASVQERTRDERGWAWLEQLWKDFGFVSRALVRARSFSLTVIATLVLGISIATVVFSLTYWILFRPLPFPEPERLVAIKYRDAENRLLDNCSSVQFLACQEQTNVFAEFAAMEQAYTNVVVADAPSVSYIASVSIDYFHTLGIKPALGRGFLPEEYSVGRANVVVISDKFWREKFAASPEILGRQILIDEQVYAIVGVLASGGSVVQGSQSPVLRPLLIKQDPAKPFSQWLRVFARLNPGVTREQATAAVAAVKLSGLPPWAETFFGKRQVALDSLSSLPTKPYWLMLAAGLLLYASACLNAMNLMMARLLGRQRELGIRLALGGSRWQIARLLLIESLGLALAAGLVVAFAWHWLFPPLATLLSNDSFTMTSSDRWWAIGWGTLGLAVGLSAVAGLAVALVPMWRLLKSDLNTALKEGGPGYGESRRMTRLRSGFVVLQATFAMILLVGTGLMVRSFEKLQRVDLGFNPTGIVKVQVNFASGYNPAPEARLQLFERLEQRLAALPGVKNVTSGSAALLDGEWQGEALKFPDGTINLVAGHSVASDFAQIAGLTLTKGRWFAARDSAQGAPTEVVINETMARQLFGTNDPLGQPIPSRKSVVVGVVRDVRGAIREPVGSHYYSPVWKLPQNIRKIVLRGLTGSSKEFAALIQRTIYAVEPKVIVTDIRTVEESIKNSLWSERFAYSILKALTPVGVGLAVVGIFSVMAYNVETRSKEFGVRMALGAKPGDLYRLVLKRGVGTAAIGVLAGIAAALGLTRFMQSLLFETAPYDPLVIAGVGALMLTSAAVACWLPARRAAKVDPVVALRAE